MFTLRTRSSSFTPQNTNCMKNHANGNGNPPMAKKLSKEIENRRWSKLSIFFILLMTPWNDTSQGHDVVDLYNQLWHECAGLTVKVPRIGDMVFYFPQGHLEQIVAYMKDEDIPNIPNYGLPSRILCKVVDVQLKAVPETEEVFAKINLLPDSVEHEGSTLRTVPQKVPASSFRKILTNSDASIHGSCILPKSCVEKTFPPLDTSHAPASQDLVAKDLHGESWRFQHVYRGSPKRHMLTRGWNEFVSAKKLVAGDTCIFMRGLGPNEIYIGVQRAVKLHKESTDLPSPSMQHGILATTCLAMYTVTDFTVYYHPRLTASAFIVAHDDVMESLKVNYSPQMGFKMVVDGGEQEPEHTLKTFSGIITGKEDIDPARWCGSEWRCLKVQWDDVTSRDVLPSRVSPWDIQPLGLVVPHQRHK